MWLCAGPGCHGGESERAGGPSVGLEEQLTLKSSGALLHTVCYLQLFSEFEHVSRKFLNIFLKILSHYLESRLQGAGVEAERAEGAASPRELATAASRPTVTVTAMRALDTRSRRPHPG